MAWAYSHKMSGGQNLDFWHNFNFFGSIIHRAENVGIPFQPGTFVLNGTWFIAVLSSCKLRTCCSHCPIHYRATRLPAGVVLSRSTISEVRVKCASEKWIINSVALCGGPTHAVCFNICFSYNVNSVFISQSVKQFRLRIMAGACSIYIVFAKQFEIFSHQFFGHVMPCKFVVFMNINPLHQYRLTVNQNCLF